MKSAALPASRSSAELFPLVGFRRRAWWVGVVVFGAVNVLLLPFWFDYLAAWRNASDWPGLGYSPADFMMVAIPVVAWLTRRQAPRAVVAGQAQAAT